MNLLEEVQQISQGFVNSSPSRQEKAKRNQEEIKSLGPRALSLAIAKVLCELAADFAACPPDMSLEDIVAEAIKMCHASIQSETRKNLSKFPNQN